MPSNETLDSKGILLSCAKYAVCTFPPFGGQVAVFCLKSSLSSRKVTLQRFNLSDAGGYATSIVLEIIFSSVIVSTTVTSEILEGYSNCNLYTPFDHTNTASPIVSRIAVTLSLTCLDVSKIKCDFMSFNGSKWLCGPMGTGVFYCKQESSNLLEPVNIGGESATLNENGTLVYNELPDRFQAGFRNYVGLAGMESSVTFLQNLGLDSIRKHIMTLSNLFIDEIGKIPEVRVFGPENENERTSIVSFEVGKNDPGKILSTLAEKGIIIAKREIYEKPILRISPHVYNTKDEILKLVEELKKL